MADLSITPANVIAGPHAVKKTGRAGAAISIGQALYRAAATGDLHPADAGDASPALAEVVGIALSSAAAAGQPVTYAAEDPHFALGATVAVGSAYVLSAAAAGGIAPDADLLAGNHATLIGIGKSATHIILKPLATGAAHA